ncbi:HTH-type transcriptional regulator GalR [Streptomyces lavendulae subsp. lavendulae]|uniref:HTH-type transcriptional regulator GalR n=1 Tax=Streptomyces lavendulae subsp. lavendulae TaxID=58340 RepID=A0A2K8PBU7_STRLA|nr:LacI family DNA-binding transcriptional regulator [Streptomyces lavendulae]ATZ23115.1 HTH-type transcriptional regulator GalR [Streptomyces lavendulae subsp. lavendulae]QUQ52952.1 HTH-type transcriptional regulator GalR [Streptomyces lavendulae subsp. lavendulae]
MSHSSNAPIPPSSPKPRSRRTPATPPPEPAPAPVPTSADVARLAGVSRATVSYVLNNAEAVRISEPTRRKVREAAEELGYVPHAAARSLRAGHTRIVLLPTSHVPVGPLYSAFLNELQWALRRLDYTVVQYGSLGLTGDEAARAWAELRPVAVISLGEVSLSAHNVATLKRAGARAVITLGPVGVPGAHALVMDQAEVGARAAAHLVERGRNRIGVIVPEEDGLELFSAPRLAGARSVPGARTQVLPMAYTEESAAELAGRWRSLGLDAVFAYNDEYAMLLMRALQDEGLDVPGDVAVMGADDLLIGRLLRPRLSTVQIELPTGDHLASLVDRAVREPSEITGRHDLMSATAVRREST